MKVVPSQTASPRAFTLMEVLLAVAIFAVVLTAISAVFHNALKLRARTTEIVEATLPLDRAVGIMKSDLAGIVPPGTLAGPMGSDMASLGLTQPAALEIYTASAVVNGDVPWGDVQKVDYTLQPPTNTFLFTGRDLVRNVTRNLLATAADTPEQQPLLSNVDTLQFSFYDGTNWNDAWSSTLSNVPVAIKVWISFTPPKSGQPAPAPLQFLVPTFIQSRTNSTDTNSTSTTN